MASPHIAPLPQQNFHLSAEPPEQDIDSLNHRRALALQQQAATPVNRLTLRSRSEIISHW